MKMSADDFQSKYASVMESMLKSAIAETTKLFQNMVDELKEEMSKIRKENEDLKTKCSQYETSKSNPDAHMGESHSVTEPGDAFVKCDSAIQCDLVPCRTILVEECEPLIQTELEKKSQQYGFEWNTLQEHDYVSYQDRAHQMELVVVKKEAQMKQEDYDPGVACGQVLANKIGSFGTSGGEAQIGTNINGSSTVPPKNITPMVLQLPCSESQYSQVAQDQSTEMRSSLVISLKDALRDDIKEEAEMVEVFKQELTASEVKQMAPQACEMNTATTQTCEMNSAITQGCEMNSATTHEQNPLESASVSAETAKEELNKKVPEGKANSKPNTSSGRRRGRPPKKRRQKQAPPPSADKDPKHQVDLRTSSVGKELADPSPPLVTSAVINSSINETADASLEDEHKDVESLSCSFPSGEQPTLQLREHSPEVKTDSTADKTSNASLDVPPLASSGLLKACKTSVSLQDALLLVEAMNQTTIESNIPPFKVPSQPEMASGSASPVGSFKTVVETSTAEQTAPVETQVPSAKRSPVCAVLPAPASANVVDLQHTKLKPVYTPPPPRRTASPSLSSSSAHQTVLQALPLPLINKTTPNKGPRKIIILPRPTLTSEKVGPHAPNSLIIPTLSKSNLPPPSKAAALPCESPVPTPVPPKMIKVVYRKQDPVMALLSSTISTDDQYVAPQTITIVSNATPSGISREPEPIAPAEEPIAPAAEPNDDKLEVPVPSESSTPLTSESKDSSSFHSGQVTSPEQINDTTEDPNSTEQISSIAEIANAPRQEHSALESVVDREEPSVSTALPQAAECKLSPVVKLTRLPLSISTKESVLISTLLSKGIIQGNSLCCSNVSEESCQLSSKLEEDVVYSDMEYEEAGDCDDAAVTQEDTSDPHVQMTKTQFLAKLHVSPLENESNINKPSNGAKSIVSRLRSHLQAHLKAKRSLEQIAEKEMEENKSLKKPRLNVQDSTAEQGRTACTISLNKISCTQSLGLSKDSGEPNDVSKISVSTKESSNVGFKKPSSGRHSVGSKNVKSSSESSVKSSSPKGSTSLKIIKSTSVSPKRSPSDGVKKSTSVSSKSPNREDSKIIANESTPKSTKSIIQSPKRLTKVVSSPDETKSSEAENNSSHEMSGSPSCSTSPKSNPKTKSMKRESSSFSPRRYIVTADHSIIETTKSEPESPSPRSFKMARDESSLEKAGESSRKKPRQLKGHRGRKTSQKVINARKLAKAAKSRGRRRVGKKRGSYKKKKLELPIVPSGVVGKCHAKVWYPPTLPPNEKPITDIIRAPPQKVEYRVPNIPVRAPPIVSPLQPLAVIGRHLLRNQCGECGRVFSNSNALESHVSLHKIYRPFSCKLCGKYFPDSKTFKRHDRVHRNGRIHVCQHCGKGFVYRFGLSKHIQMVHGRIRPFICQVCGNGFYTKRDVEIHIRIHTGEKPFQCHICERRFTRKVELNVHLRWHNGEKRHWCQYCGKGFLDYNNLKRHKYIHTGEKPYSCPYCPKNFTQTGHLKKHVRNVHKK